MQKTLLSIGLLSTGAIVSGNQAVAAKPVKVTNREQASAATAPPIDRAVAFQVEQVMAQGKKTVNKLASNSTVNPTNSAEIIKNLQLAQSTPVSVPNDAEIQELQRRLNDVSNQKFQVTGKGGGSSLSPEMSISNPVAFGADNNKIFLSGSFQSRTRYTQTSDGELGIGYAFGNARNGGIGGEISYAINSFGTSQNFGAGGFSLKLHSQIANNTAVALGWNRFLTVESKGKTDFPKNSYYGAITHIISTQEDINQPFSRIALTAGVGGGQFLSEKTLQNTVGDPSGLNVFGSMALRVAKGISAIVEYTGQDLSAGLSIVPFEGLPLVITPAFRDLSGAGDGARFVLGGGLSFQL